MYKIDNNTITVASLSVRGIGNNAKRRETFNWLRSKKYSIYLLQEVHCSQENSHLWASDGEYKSLFSSFFQQQSWCKHSFQQ